jgi:hypothetical protein
MGLRERFLVRIRFAANNTILAPTQVQFVACGNRIETKTLAPFNPTWNDFVASTTLPIDSCRAKMSPE